MPALPAPPGSPDVDDADLASDADMAATAPEIERYVDPHLPASGPAESDAADVPVTDSDEELKGADNSRTGVDERRRKVQGGYPETPKRQKYEDRGREPRRLHSSS